MLIFEQYQVSPIVVGKCDKEIHEHCHVFIGKDKDDGAMMNCLMGVAANNHSAMGEQCFDAVSFYFHFEVFSILSRLPILAVSKCFFWIFCPESLHCFKYLFLIE